MSEIVNHTFRVASSFNKKFAISNDVIESIPSCVIEESPDLLCDPSSIEYYNAVINLQKVLWPNRPDLADGMLGKSTLIAISKAYSWITESSQYWVKNNIRVPVDSTYNFLNYDQEGGKDLHKFGNFSRRRSKPKIVVVHWGGLNLDHCYRVFSTKERKVSSHCGIGFNDEGKDLTIAQFLDFDHKSWHAGWANDLSVGIDICQQPDLKWKDYYDKREYGLKEIDNTSGRGPSKCLSLNPHILEATQEAVKTICEIYDIPYDIPRDNLGNPVNSVLDKNYIKEEYTGILGHHHISSHKWDCAPWWQDLFG
jgi:hypothetical protein